MYFYISGDDCILFFMVQRKRFVVNLIRQHDWTYDHHGNTPLGVPNSVFRRV